MAFGFLKKKADPGKNRTRLFFVTDIHGSDVCFRKFCSALDFYNCNVIILGGDMTGKMVVPIIQKYTGRYTAQYSGRDVILETGDELERFIRQMKNMGFYPRTMTPDDFEEISASPEKQATLFRHMISDRLHEWSEYAAQKFKGRDVKIYCAPGNDDEDWVDEIIEQSDVFELVENRRVFLPDGREMVSTAWSNPTPWDTPRECSEEELEARLEALSKQIENMDNAIFNIHAPPCNTKLDECPALDENLKPISNMGQPVMKAVGSTSARKVIEKYQPLIGLHGHIHEGKGTYKMNRTLCVNPGSDYTEGLLRGCILTLDNAQVLDVQFTSG